MEQRRGVQEEGKSTTLRRSARMTKQRLEPASVHRPGSSMGRQSSKQSTHLILGELILQRGEAEARKYRLGKRRGRPGWTARWQKSVLPADRSSAGGSGGLHARPPGAPQCSYSLRRPCCDAGPSPQGRSQCRTAGRPPPEPREGPSSSFIQKQKRDLNGKVKSASTTEARTHTPSHSLAFRHVARVSLEQTGPAFVE